MVTCCHMDTASSRENQRAHAAGCAAGQGKALIQAAGQGRGSGEAAAAAAAAAPGRDRRAAAGRTVRRAAAAAPPGRQVSLRARSHAPQPPHLLGPSCCSAPLAPWTRAVGYAYAPWAPAQWHAPMCGSCRAAFKRAHAPVTRAHAPCHYVQGPAVAAVAAGTGLGRGRLAGQVLAPG